MPQLVKGGKYVFGFTRINSDRQVRVPDETCDEYHFTGSAKIILLPGSKASGGFSILTIDSIKNTKFGSRLSGGLGYLEGSGVFTAKKLEMVQSGGRMVCWTSLDRGKRFSLSDEIIAHLGLTTGSKLLVARGSGMGPAFISKGRIFNEALRHKYLLEYE